MDISTWDIPVRNYSDTHALSACLPLQCYTEWIHTSPFADSQGASAPAPSTASSKATPAVLDDPQETTFYEGSGAPAELAISLLLGLLIIPIPLTIASIGRRLWISYRFTNKRIIVTNTSPLFSRQVQVAYKNIKEIRSAPRALGLWGDMVVFLKDGSRLEIAGLEKYQDIRRHIESCMYD
eukprot:jgi/Chrzof1/885/Cz01g32200.t1